MRNKVKKKIFVVYENKIKFELSKKQNEQQRKILE